MCLTIVGCGDSEVKRWRCKSKRTPAGTRCNWDCVVESQFRPFACLMNPEPQEWELIPSLSCPNCRIPLVELEKPIIINKARITAVCPKCGYFTAKEVKSNEV